SVPEDPGTTFHGKGHPPPHRPAPRPVLLGHTLPLTARGGERSLRTKQQLSDADAALVRRADRGPRPRRLRAGRMRLRPYRTADRSDADHRRHYARHQGPKPWEPDAVARMCEQGDAR